MIRWFREKRDEVVGKIRAKRKEGASLVSVVIGTMFLLALGVAILTVSTRYVVSVIVDRNSTDNFYEAEGVLAEIHSGLVEKAAAAAKVAYQDALQNYTTQKDVMQKKFAKTYICELSKSFAATALTESNLDSSLGKTLDCKNNINDELKALSTIKGGNVVMWENRNTHSPNAKYVVNKDSSDNYILTLLNLHVTCENDPDYVSVIDTDITFSTPNYNFEGDDTLAQLKDYIVICDDTFHIKNDGGESLQKTKVTGNVYTGNGDKGINVDKYSGVKFDSNKIISRGGLNLCTGSKTVLSGGSYWLQNICLESTDSAVSKSEGEENHTELEIASKSKCYISNDLDIQDHNATVKLNGIYYGFSYNEKNLGTETVSGHDVAVEGLDSTYSSAILVNGFSATLDGSGLDKMVLAGRSFIERHKNSASPSEIAGSDQDIRMAESIAVKSNQLAYLVPNKYINVGHNPISSQEVPMVTEAGSTHADLTGCVNTAVLMADLGSYLKGGSSFVNPDKDGQNGTIVLNYSQEGGYVYLFLNFENEKAANKYFKNYYNGTDEDGNSNSAWLEERGATYLKSMSLKEALFSNHLYLIAGNIVRNYEVTGGASGIQDANYYNGSGEPLSTLLDDSRKIARNYLGYCLTLVPSLYPKGPAQSYGKQPERVVNDTGSKMSDNGIRLTTKEDRKKASDYSTTYDETNDMDNRKLVAHRIIDSEKFSNFSADETTIKLKAAGKEVKVIICKGDCSVVSPEKALVIANGNVTVSRGFEGLILSNGTVNDVIPKSNFTTDEMKSNMVLIDEILNMIKNYESVTKADVQNESELDNVKLALKNTKQLFYAWQDGAKESTSAFAKCVNYQNWKKNTH